DERYQLAKEIRLDLKNLRRELELSAEIERSKQPVSTDDSRLRHSLSDADAPVTGSVPIRATAGATKEFSVKPKLVKSLLSVVALLAFAVVGIGIYRWFTRNPFQATANMHIARLTTTGTEDKAAISPDGKYIVHASTENGRQSLRVRQVNTTSDVQI